MEITLHFKKNKTDKTVDNTKSYLGIGTEDLIKRIVWTKFFM